MHAAAEGPGCELQALPAGRPALAPAANRRLRWAPLLPCPAAFNYLTSNGYSELALCCVLVPPQLPA